MADAGRLATTTPGGSRPGAGSQDCLNRTSARWKPAICLVMSAALHCAGGKAGAK